MFRRIIILIALASLSAILFACGSPAGQEIKSPITNVSESADGEGYYTCEYNGTERKYILHIPEGIGENAPLVFMLHGFTGNSKECMENTNMNSTADKYGYAVVYPQGLCGTKYNKSSTCWNADLEFTDTDDTGFLVALAGYLQQKYGFNESSTFAAGFSNGGYMCYKLACNAHDTFRAVASISGTMSGITWNGRDALVSVPVLQIHGTADRSVPIGGLINARGGWGGAPAISEIIEYWKGADNAHELEQASIADKVTAYRYSSKENDNLVWYIEIEGFGHEWPKEENAGFSANEAIFEFFSNYVN